MDDYLSVAVMSVIVCHNHYSFFVDYRCRGRVLPVSDSAYAFVMITTQT